MLRAAAGSALQPAVPFPTGQPDECLPLSHGSTRSGNLKARLHQLHASERFSDHLTCNGLQMRFSRVDMDEVATRWNTLMRTSSEQIVLIGSKSNFSLFSNPIVSIDGDAMNQSSHNTAFMCDSDGHVVAYGGRVGNRGGRDGPYGLHHGLLRWTGHATPDGVAWGPPMTVMNLEKARSLNCAEGRADWESCELDGKLSAVEFKGRAFLFARYNYAYGGRTVQVASAPKAAPGNLSRFEAVELEGVARNTTNLYFASVAVRADGEKLVGLFPGILRDEGGVWLSDSADGVHWSRPLRLMEVPIHRGADGSARTALHSVGGFSASADGAVHFEVDHRINLDHTCGINSQSGKPKPMHAPELLCDPATTLDHLTCRGAKLYLPRPDCEPKDYPYTCSYTYYPETLPAAQPAAAQPDAAHPASTVGTDDARPASSALALSAAGTWGMAYL